MPTLQYPGGSKRALGLLSYPAPGILLLLQASRCSCIHHTSANHHPSIHPAGSLLWTRTIKMTVWTSPFLALLFSKWRKLWALMRAMICDASEQKCWLYYVDLRQGAGTCRQMETCALRSGISLFWGSVQVVQRPRFLTSIVFFCFRTL
jgi:hypothetical protein